MIQNPEGIFKKRFINTYKMLPCIKKIHVSAHPRWGGGGESFILFNMVSLHFRSMSTSVQAIGQIR